MLRGGAGGKIPPRSCNNACKQCAVATKIVIQRTRLFFRAALLKIGGNFARWGYLTFRTPDHLT